jgi:hypothetical protein
MKSAFEYRSYEVRNEGGFYIAKSLDGEPGQLVSKYLLRVLRSIDVFWEVLETAAMPEWCAIYLQGNALHCDLDVFADSLSPSLPSQCSNDGDEPLATVHQFFPASAKPAMRVVAAA